MKKFKLTILGSGTMMPTKKKHPPGYLLEVDNKKILLDIGPTTISRLIDMEIELDSIDILFISHYHTDHFADFLPFVHARMNKDMRNKKEHKRLMIFGPKDIKDKYLKLRKIFWPEQNEDYPLDFYEDIYELTIGNVQFQTFEVKHVPWFQSVGIKIIYNNKSFVYTGDIGSNHDIDSLKALVRDVDLLLIDAGYIRKTPNHFTVEQIIEIVGDANVKKAIGTHLSEKNVHIQNEQIKEYGNIQLAEDLMEVNI